MLIRLQLLFIDVNVDIREVTAYCNRCVTDKSVCALLLKSHYKTVFHYDKTTIEYNSCTVCSILFDTSKSLLFSLTADK